MNFLKSSGLVLVLFLSACFPEETAIPAVERVNKSQFISSGVDKRDVTFFSLEKGEIVAEASPMDWDLYVDEDKVRLNYFRSMRAAKTELNWHEIEDTVGLDFLYLSNDSANKLSQWELALDQIYVLDYGFDNDYVHMGFICVKVQKTDDGIQIWYNKLGSDFEVFKLIEKESFYYNLRELEEIILPKETEYDIAFGKYTEFITIEDESQDYEIFGAILGNSLAYSVEQSFEEVLDENFDVIRLDGDKTVIGWDWKSYNLSKGAYEIAENVTYLISTNSGFKYKMRFVSYYDEEANSGHPTFEYELL